jgi:hypothetical protein
MKKSETTARLGDKRDQCCTYEDELRKYGLRLSSVSFLEDDDEDERAAKKTRKRRRIDSEGGRGRRRRGKEEEVEETEEEATVRAKFDAHNARADAFI